MVEYNDLGKFPHTPLPEIWAQGYNYYVHIATTTLQYTAGVKAELSVNTGTVSILTFDGHVQFLYLRTHRLKYKEL